MREDKLIQQDNIAECLKGNLRISYYPKQILREAEKKRSSPGPPGGQALTSQLPPGMLRAPQSPSSPFGRCSTMAAENGPCLHFAQYTPLSGSLFSSRVHFGPDDSQETGNQSKAP